MRLNGLNKPWNPTLVLALAVAGMSVSAQTIAVRAGNAVADAGKIASRGAAATPSLGAGVPTLGFVGIGDEIYRIDGIAGGASLTKVLSEASRGDTARAGDGWAVLASAGGRWVRSARSGRVVELSATVSGGGEPLQLNVEMAVGQLALSPNGRALAVAGTGDAGVRLYRISEESPELVEALEMGSPDSGIQSLTVADDASSVLAVVTRNGWSEALAWNVETGRTATLAQGASLRAQLSADGRRIAVLNAESQELSTFDRGTGGFTLVGSRLLPALESPEPRGHLEIASLRGSFVVAEIRGHDVRVCGESGGCIDGRLPLAEARSIRALPGQDLLFVESARAGVPSYLLEIEGGRMRWHFVGRSGSQPRGATDRRTRVETAASRDSN